MTELVKKRIEFADRLKGLCICLVILGHSAIPSGLFDFIYSFHMPAFFFINGFFFSKRSSLKADARRLLVPYLLCALFVLCKDFVDALRINDFSQVLYRLEITGLVGPMSAVGIENYSVGPIWFFAALFWSRQIFSLFLYKPKFTPFALFVGLIATLIGHCDNIPFGLCQGVSGLLFLTSGYYFKKFYEQQKTFGLAWIPLVALSLVGLIAAPMDMNYNLYPLPILKVAGSIAITIMACKGFILVETNRFIGLKFLSYLGRISILIFAVHHIEIIHFHWYEKFATFPEYGVTALRLAADIIAAIILSRIPQVKKIFMIK